MSHVRKLAFAAIFVALAFVFGLLSITVSNAQFGITELPLMLSGFVLGPVYGALVGGVKDVVTMITRGYPPSLFTLAPIILGLIPGLFLVIFGKKRLYESTVLIATCVYLTTLTRTVITSFALHYVIGLEWEAVYLGLPMRLGALVVEGVVYTMVLKILLPLIRKHFFTD